MERGRERSWFTFEAQLSTEDVGATSRDANSLIRLTCGVLILSTTPLKASRRTPLSAIVNGGVHVSTAGVSLSW